MTEPEKWRRETNNFLQKTQNSYWLAHRLLKSKNQVYYGDVYNLPDELGLFDVVLVGQILIHLADPISALASISKRCNGLLILTEGMVDSEDTTAKFFAQAAAQGPEWLWWRYSIGTYRELMAIMGYEVLSVTKNQYRCYHEYIPGDVEIMTMVSRKK